MFCQVKSDLATVTVAYLHKSIRDILSIIVSLPDYHALPYFTQNKNKKRKTQTNAGAICNTNIVWFPQKSKGLNQKIWLLIPDPYVKEVVCQTKGLFNQV